MFTDRVAGSFEERKGVAEIFIVRMEAWRVMVVGVAAVHEKVRTHSRELEETVVLEWHSARDGDGGGVFAGEAST